MAIWHCYHPDIAMQDNRVARIAVPLEMHLLLLKCNLEQIIKGVLSAGLFYRTHLYLVIISHRYENNI